MLENEGIFINYVNHADFSFGGGDVVVSGMQVRSVPFTLNEARPTLSFNTITNSAGAAIAADPNSFKDNLFNEVGREFVEGRVTIANGVATLDRRDLADVGRPRNVDNQRRQVPALHSRCAFEQHSTAACRHRQRT